MAAGPGIESIRYDDLPSPEQVGQLATALVEFAQRHGKLSTYGDVSNGENRKQIIKSMQSFEISSLDIPDVYYLQSKLSGHLEDNLDGIRRLRIHDTLIRREIGQRAGQGVRSMYDFAWTDHQVTSARRQVVSLPYRKNDEPMIDVVDRMVTTGISPFGDHDATTLYVMTEMNQLTDGDTDLLAEQIDRRMNEVDSGNRQYFELGNKLIGSITR